MEASNGHTPQPTYLHSTLPETVKHESQAPGAADTAKESYFTAGHDANNPYAYPPNQAPRRRSWTRWPFLLLFGLVIAILAGLIGGFIGKAIGDNKNSNKDANSQAQGGSACSSAAPASPTNATSSTPSNQIVVPKTGCPDTSGRTFQSTYSNVTYKIFCNVNWIGNDIAAIYSPTISDCVEACNTVNQYNPGKTCLGSTFVPGWVNRTLALERVDRAGNCFMKYAASGYPANTEPFEIVVTCLEGKCPQG